MKILKKKLILFDLDGVLIDSEINMRFSWNKVKKKFFINLPFEKYRSFIGMAFIDILNNLNIKKKKIEIEKYYKSVSKSNFKLIKIYPGVIKTLKNLSKKNKIGILTSKDQQRTDKIVKKFFKKINFSCVQSPEKNYRPKPAPDLILKIISKMKIDPSECCYVGDSKFDQQMSNRSNIDFIYASYGYGDKSIKSKYKIKKISDIFNIIKY